MTKIDPLSEKAETLFYEQFMTEMFTGIEKIKSGLSNIIAETVGEDIQYIAFTKALAVTGYEITHDSTNDTYHITDKFGQEGTKERLYSSFNRLAIKLVSEPQSTLESSSLAR